MKPLGRKAYGSIGHLPNSRLGPSDSSVTEGQAKICCEKARDKHDVIVVQEKLDGSNVAVALKNNTIYPLTRAGYVADTSPFEQHHMFHRWVMEREDMFRKLLKEGERISGEWLAQAHGTLYNLEDRPPFAAFDLFTPDNMRSSYEECVDRLRDSMEELWMPALISYGPPMPVHLAMDLHESLNYGADEIEGLVYRVERKGKVDFLAKYVRPDKVDGKYLESYTGKPPIYNWTEK